MSTWMWMVLLAFGLIKLPIAALMLWIPFRSDGAMASLYPGESATGPSEEDDGGSKTLSGADHGGGRGPHPRAPRPGLRPRRGPHGEPAPPSPARSRLARERVTRVRARP
jgi:hypothetical protein